MKCERVNRELTRMDANGLLGEGARGVMMKEGELLWLRVIP